jgi:hypothetical protein
VLEERTVAMLVAETPIAAREHRVAREDHARAVRVIEAEEWALAALLREQSEFLERLTPGNPITITDRRIL